MWCRPYHLVAGLGQAGTLDLDHTRPGMNTVSPVVHEAATSLLLFGCFWSCFCDFISVCNFDSGLNVTHPASHSL